MKEFEVRPEPAMERSPSALPAEAGATLEVATKLPMIELVEGAFYWVRNRHGEDPEAWTIARWNYGCWWNANGGEAAPSVIVGPIPQPKTETA